MCRITALILISLFMPFFSAFILGVNMTETGLLSYDKLTKLILIYIGIIVVFKRKKTSFPRDFPVYFWLLVSIIAVLSLHQLYTDSTGFFAINAQKEIVRLSTFLIVLFIVALYGLRVEDCRFLVLCFAFIGLTVGLISVYHSITGVSDMTGKYVGGFLRAGTGIIGANFLGSLLNLATLASIAGYLTVSKVQYKPLFFFAIIGSQLGRFTTFSSGSFFSIIISVFVLLLLLRTYDRKNYVVTVKALFVASCVLLGAVIISGTGEVVLYRLFLSDEYVMSSSIGSRLEQYEAYIALISKDPWGLLVGYGAADFPVVYGLSMTMHNVFVRSLAIGGVVCFTAFTALWYLSFKNFTYDIKSEDGLYRTISICFFAAFIGWTFQSLTLPAFASTLQWFFFILAYALRHLERTETAAVAHQPNSNKNYIQMKFNASTSCK